MACCIRHSLVSLLGQLFFFSFLTNEIRNVEGNGISSVETIFDEMVVHDKCVESRRLDLEFCSMWPSIRIDDHERTHSPLSMEGAAWNALWSSMTVV